MNIDDAKNIPLQELVEKIGGVFAYKRRGHEIWYHSPFRADRNPSFKVDTRTNTWKDFGHHLPGGDIIDLWADFHNRNRREAISDALKDLEQFDRIPRITRQFIETKEYSTMYKVLSRSDTFKDKNLKGEMKRRGLPKEAFINIMDEAFILNTESGNKFNAFAIDNEKGGIEISGYIPKKNKPFEDPHKLKTCIGPKAPTVFYADQNADNITAFTFSSGMDYVTFRHLMGKQKPDEQCIIYHGDSLIQMCADIVIADARIKKVRHFKHVDDPGDKADAALALLLEGYDYGSMEKVYYPHKDLSEAYMKQRNLVVSHIKPFQTTPTYRPNARGGPGPRTP